MSGSSDLAKLVGLTELVLDHRLHKLREAAAARDRSRMQIEAISAAAGPAGLPPVTEAFVGLAYRRWADIRKSELNAVIARQTVSWIDARSQAVTAFGRAQAVRSVIARVPRK